MPALDDYDPPAPLWLAICAALERAPGRELSVTKLHGVCAFVSRGRFARGSSVSELLTRMRDEGIVRVRMEGPGRRPAQIHTLTPLGREFFLEARELAFALLDTTPAKKRK